MLLFLVFLFCDVIHGLGVPETLELALGGVTGLAFSTKKVLGADSVLARGVLRDLVCFLILRDLAARVICCFEVQISNNGVFGLPWDLLNLNEEVFNKVFWDH